MKTQKKHILHEQNNKRNAPQLPCCPPHQGDIKINPEICCIEHGHSDLCRKHKSNVGNKLLVKICCKSKYVDKKDADRYDRRKQRPVKDITRGSQGSDDKIGARFSDPRKRRYDDDGKQSELDLFDKKTGKYKSFDHLKDEKRIGKIGPYDPKQWEEQDDKKKPFDLSLRDDPSRDDSRRRPPQTTIDAFGEEGGTGGTKYDGKITGKDYNEKGRFDDSRDDDTRRHYTIKEKFDDPFDPDKGDPQMNRKGEGGKGSTDERDNQIRGDPRRIDPGKKVRSPGTVSKGDKEYYDGRRRGPGDSAKGGEEYSDDRRQGKDPGDISKRSDENADDRRQGPGPGYIPKEGAEYSDDQRRDKGPGDISKGGGEYSDDRRQDKGPGIISKGGGEYSDDRRQDKGPGDISEGGGEYSDDRRQGKTPDDIPKGDEENADDRRQGKGPKGGDENADDRRQGKGPKAGDENADDRRQGKGPKGDEENADDRRQGKGPGDTPIGGGEYSDDRRRGKGPGIATKGVEQYPDVRKRGKVPGDSTRGGDFFKGFDQSADDGIEWDVPDSFPDDRKRGPSDFPREDVENADDPRRGSQNGERPGIPSKGYKRYSDDKRRGSQKGKSIGTPDEESHDNKGGKSIKRGDDRRRADSGEDNGGDQSKKRRDRSFRGSKDSELKGDGGKPSTPKDLRQRKSDGTILPDHKDRKNVRVLDSDNDFTTPSKPIISRGSCSTSDLDGDKPYTRYTPCGKYPCEQRSEELSDRSNTKIRRQPTCSRNSPCQKLLLQRKKQTEEVEPRSFCYNIASKPDTVCKPGTCFLRTDLMSDEREETESEIYRRKTAEMRSELFSDKSNICTQKPRPQLSHLICATIKGGPCKPIKLRKTVEEETITETRIQGLEQGARRGKMCPCCKCDPCLCGLGEDLGEDDGFGIKEDWIIAAEAKDVEATKIDKVSCTCLPGLCICPHGPKYVREAAKEAARKKKQEELVEIPSCLCLMDDEPIHYISPATTSVSGQVQDSMESFSIPCCTCRRYQSTIAIVKPGAMIYQDVILRAIEKGGLDLVNKRIVHLTPEQVSELYEQYYGTSQFPLYVLDMSVAPSLVLQLAGIDAVKRWKNMVGPEKVLPTDWFLPLSVRQRFGVQTDIFDAVHASEDPIMAETENRYFFPHPTLEPILYDKQEVKDYMNKYINPTLCKGLISVVRNKPRDPILYLAEYLVTTNPYMPNLPKLVAMTPT